MLKFTNYQKALVVQHLKMLKGKISLIGNGELKGIIDVDDILKLRHYYRWYKLSCR